MKRSAALLIGALALAACNNTTTTGAGAGGGSDYCRQSIAVGEKHGDVVLEVSGALTSADLGDSFEEARKGLQGAAQKAIDVIEGIIRDLRTLESLVPAEIKADFAVVIKAFQDAMANFREYRDALENVTEANEQQIAAQGEAVARPLEAEAFTAAATNIGEYEAAGCDGRGLFVAVETEGGTGGGSSGGGSGTGGTTEAPDVPQQPDEPDTPTEAPAVPQGY